MFKTEIPGKGRKDDNDIRKYGDKLSIEGEREETKKDENRLVDNKARTRQLPMVLMKLKEI